MNFPVFDRAGFLYASENGTWRKREGVVHRFTPEGRGEPWIKSLHFANGLALDAAESALYVAQSTKDNVVRVPVLSDGRAGRPSIYVEGISHVPDGLAFDANGFLYVSCYGDNRIWRISPNGEKSLLVEDPTSILLNRTTNLAFGGRGRRTLFVANLGGWHIAKISMPVAGQPLAAHHP
jgi:sugar lactone lactonase YvrE